MKLKNNFNVLMSDWMKKNRPIDLTNAADLAGVDRRRLAAWRDDTILVIGRHELRKLCEFFDCKPGDLLDLAEGEEEVDQVDHMFDAAIELMNLVDVGEPVFTADLPIDLADLEGEK